MRDRDRGIMEKIINYRRHADECRALASRARSSEERTMLIEMADSWEALAATRGRALSLRPDSI